MPSYVHRVPEGLAPYVRSCIGYDYRLDPDATHHGLPSRGITVIIAFEEPLDCAWLDDAERGRFDTPLAGLHTSPSLIRTHGHQHGIQLALTPRGVRALFGAPAGAFARALVDGDEDDRIPSSLQRRLQDLPWRERFTLLDQYLLGRVDTGRAGVRPELARAWSLLGTGPTVPRVEQVAREVGLSRRQLLIAFRDEYGVTPTEARRLARFEVAQHLLRDGLAAADVAARAGYADQPHMNREWRALAAMTPAGTLEDFPVVQDEAP